MAVIERDVVLQSVDDSGRQTMDFPITRLGNVEDAADVKAAPVGTDYLPIVDSADGGQMKKTPLRVILDPLEAAQTAAQEAKTAAENAATMEQVDAAIQAAVLKSWEGAY